MSRDVGVDQWHRSLDVFVTNKSASQVTTVKLVGLHLDPLLISRLPGWSLGRIMLGFCSYGAL